MSRFNYIEPLVMLATIMQWLVLATVTGILAGAGCAAFLLALEYFTSQTASIPLGLQMALLPAGGLLTGLIMHYGYKLNRTGLDDAVISAVHKQSGRMPFLTLPVKPIAALVTLSAGGSAGREGPCSHVGATMASGLGKVLRLNEELRKRLVACGVSAGFASVFGTPVAGAIYGVEVMVIGRLRHDFLFPAVIAGMTAFETCQWLGVSYRYYTLPMPAYSHLLFFKVLMLGVMCGAVAWLFVEMVRFSTHLFSRMQRRFGIWPPLMPLIGGSILALLILVIPTDYLGLGLPLMAAALEGESMPFFGFLWKILLVAITLGSGFYGGIATPQLVVGAISGAAFAPLLDISPALGGAIGLVSVVAGASNTPLAGILMGVEFFGGGPGIGYFAGAGIAAYLISGHRSVYPDQLMAYPKSSWMRSKPDLPLGQERIGLSYGLLRGLARYQSRHGRHRRTHPPRE